MFPKTSRGRCGCPSAVVRYGANHHTNNPSIPWCAAHLRLCDAPVPPGLRGFAARRHLLPVGAAACGWPPLLLPPPPLPLPPRFGCTSRFRGPAYTLSHDCWAEGVLQMLQVQSKVAAATCPPPAPCRRRASEAVQRQFLSMKFLSGAAAGSPAVPFAFGRCPASVLRYKAAPVDGPRLRPAVRTARRPLHIRPVAILLHCTAGEMSTLLGELHKMHTLPGE